MDSSLNESLSHKVRILYEYYQSRLSNTPYRLRELHPNQQAMIGNFIKLLNKRTQIYSIGNEYLISYFNYQFGRWYDIASEQFGTKKVQIGWIIGKKAAQLWFERDIDFDYSILITKFIQRCQVSRKEIEQLLIEDQVLNSSANKVTLDIIEEQDKSRFHNQSIGYMYCIQTTTLYNHRSKWCILCKMQKECKELLNVNYSQLYKSRGYGERQTDR